MDQVLDGLVGIHPDRLRLARDDDDQVDLTILLTRHCTLLSLVVFSLYLCSEGHRFPDSAGCFRNYAAVAPLAASGQTVGVSEHGDPPVAQQATALLLAIAVEPDGPAGQAYDALCYPALLRFLRNRAGLAKWTATQQTGTGGELPFVVFADADEVAHDAVVLGLRRAKRAAERFDPAKGDGLSWALRQTVYAYREVVVERAGARRKLRVAPVDDARLEEIAEARAVSDPADEVAAADLLDRCMAPLNPEEAQAVLLFERSGCSYQEIAMILFGSATATKRVDRLLQGARAKMRAAYLREHR